MSTGNPWQKKEFKKRVITVSVTEEQNEAFEKMKVLFHEDTDGGMIKTALAVLWDDYPSGWDKVDDEEV